MTKTSENTRNGLKILGLILCLGALPLVVGLTGCVGDRYNQSSGQRADEIALPSVSAKHSPRTSSIRNQSYRLSHSKAMCS